MERRNRNLLLAGIGVAVLIFCCCIAVLAVLAGSYLFLSPATRVERPADRGPVVVVTPAATVRRPTGTPRVAPAPGSLQPAPTPGTGAATTQPKSTAALAATVPVTATSAVTTTEALVAAAVPERDLRSLALRLKPNVGNIPAVVNAAPPTYKVGDTISFWSENSDTQVRHHISATLQYMTSHVYMWVEKGVTLDTRALKASADRFESKTYPTDREFFGSEWSPGVDNDVHLSILHARDLGATIAGYYSSSDEFSHLVNPYSNEKEMFYIASDRGAALPNTSYYDSTLAHEFQHMIHWYHDRNEESWVNEGFSMLAEHLNGFDTGGFDADFAALPDTQLNTWSDPSIGNREHYGASYLFMTYFLGRFGEGLTKAVVAHQENGIAGFDSALAEAGRAERFNDIFADWLIANYLNRPDAAPKGRFGYPDITPPAPAIAKSYDRLPATARSGVSQYAADYIQVKNPAGNVTVTFDGQPQIGLVDTAPRGKYAWWSNRGDDSDATLTRPVDLSAVKSATLGFSAWWDVENGWDYVYVEASTDGGQHWQVLSGRQSNDKDKSGNAFGPGWTGASGGASPQWVDERVDLSKYGGQKILLRFEYVTDDAVNGPGFLLDDIRIPEINFSDNGEDGPLGWQAAGWVLTDNTLVEPWLVQLVTGNGSEVQVQRVPVGPDGHGEVTLTNNGTLNNMLLIVSPQAPVTTEQASYSYNITAR